MVDNGLCYSVYINIIFIKLVHTFFSTSIIPIYFDTVNRIYNLKKKLSVSVGETIITHILSFNVKRRFSICFSREKNYSNY